MGKDKDGLCCSGKIDPATNQCSGTCKTRFRVCLKNYQAKIDMTSPCTFGDVMTPVVGENSMNLTALTENMDFVNPIRFPFDFTWPVSTISFYLFLFCLSFEFCWIDVDTNAIVIPEINSTPRQWREEKKKKRFHE